MKFNKRDAPVTPQRISPQRVLEIAMQVGPLWENRAARDLRQLADQMERDAKALLAAEQIRELRQALADRDRREETRGERP